MPLISVFTLLLLNSVVKGKCVCFCIVTILSILRAHAIVKV